MGRPSNPLPVRLLRRDLLSGDVGRYYKTTPVNTGVVSLMCATQSWRCYAFSLLALRNSRIESPIPRASSGSFLPPNMTSNTRPMTTISVVPMPLNINNHLPSSYWHQFVSEGSVCQLKPDRQPVEN